jgi:ribosomal protein L17
MNPTTEKIITRFIQHEEIMAQLYTVFAEKFPERKKFWAQMALEEHGHANWIRQLEKLLMEGQIGEANSVFNLSAVAALTEEVDRLIQQCQNGEVEERRAITFAYSVENSLLEKSFFKVFDFAPQVKLGEALQKATTEHKERVSQLLEEILNPPKPDKSAPQPES